MKEFDETFKLLAQLIKRQEEGDAQGHEKAPPLDGANRQLIEDFARGQATEAQRSEALVLLQSNPEWIGEVAKLARKNREA